MIMLRKVRAPAHAEVVGLLLQGCASLLSVGCLYTGSISGMLFSILLYWLGRDAENDAVKVLGPRWAQ